MWSAVFNLSCDFFSSFWTLELIVHKGERGGLSLDQLPEANRQVSHGFSCSLTFAGYEERERERDR